MSIPLILIRHSLTGKLEHWQPEQDQFQNKNNKNKQVEIFYIFSYILWKTLSL